MTTDPADRRRLPNILICGTPGTGKTTTSTLLHDRLSSTYGSPEAGREERGGFRLLTIGDLVKQHALHTGHDAEWDAFEVDDDKLLDYLEPLCIGGDNHDDRHSADASDNDRGAGGGGGGGGCIIDWHECELFPESWIDLVVVLRCDHTRLWDRLEARGYSLKKVQENNEAEIMQVVLDEAREFVPEECVVELQSDDVDQMEDNVGRIVAWVEQWRRDRETES